MVLLTLADDAARVRSDFDSTDAAEFLDTVSRIRNSLRTGETKSYLAKKLDAVRFAPPAERRVMCRNLLPYLDWYLSGN